MLFTFFHYLNLENAHILCSEFPEDLQINYHGPRQKFGNKNIIETYISTLVLTTRLLSSPIF